MDEICKLLQQMRNLGLHVIEDLSNFFSFMVGKGGREYKALETLKYLKARGFCNVSIYSIIIQALHKIGDVKGALSLFEEMKDSEYMRLRLCNNVIPCFVDVGDIKAACSCYNKMKEKSWVPTISAYSSLVYGLCKIGEIDAALTLVRHCLGNVTYKWANRFQIYLEHHPCILSSKFFHWAGKQKGFRHDFASYNAFAYCLNRTNYFRAADQVPELMNMQGKPPTEKQFEILIRMHSDAGRGLRVYYVYEKMKKFGIKPRVFLYNRVMDALVKTDHLDLALAVYEDFKEDGLVEESVTFMILIKGLCREGRIDEAFELLGRMRENLCKPDVFTYTAMIRVLIAKGI
ncbi:hypothetical protein IFM89_026023 [Coptis chinensis]|uniref:Pentatricopeptide repeat-containing protein n=1 Tax=Coptis chinensis TaxID=261450 RepID=A0A835M6K2_9MAGN|nr:hypothetical protein IFM89_026023 [Coptis chinensis]